MPSYAEMEIHTFCIQLSMRINWILFWSLPLNQEYISESCFFFARKKSWFKHHCNSKPTEYLFLHLFEDESILTSISSVDPLFSAGKYYFLFPIKDMNIIWSVIDWGSASCTVWIYGFSFFISVLKCTVWFYGVHYANGLLHFYVCF